MPTSIAIADDHRLLAEALSDLIQKYDNYEVLYVAANGRDLLNRLHQGPVPDIALVDLNMPEMDGFETAVQLRQHYPAIRVLALSMTDREEHIVRMIRNGARGYLLKGCRPAELRQALDEVMAKGFYYSDFLTSQLIRSLNTPESGSSSSYFNLNGREYDFLKLACSELTYNEIADRMCVSPRTVDGYREAVFQKMGVRTRVGMVIEAVRNGLIEL
ncbi:MULTISPECIES: response regulator transcription factor [Spirosoma]|uniref:Response regulator transcription factor n=2 Tax=Spirosoma TaxID=107 RepID=A0A6G9AVN8_9BACT|nr:MULTISPECIES: response regulator transcription factor [Spirosoma]QHV96350.1 response regulator [Spirosoma endbachense]QIP16406.1 response regulator transcription factor [Spirosoma aureum]